MQSVGMTRELDNAINSIEKLLNGKDGELILDVIRNYKKYKTVDQNAMLKLNQNLYM